MASSQQQAGGWQPIRVDMPDSLAELRTKGLNQAQVQAFLHWRAHQRVVWLHAIIGPNDDPDDFYNPDAQSHDDVIVEWYVRTLMSQDPEEDEAEFEDATGFYANPLYDPSTSEKDIMNSMPVITISAHNNHTIPAGHEDIARTHKQNLEEMEGKCPVRKGAISSTRYFTSCQHTGCAECIIGWLKYQSSCPTCRKDVMHEQAILIQLQESGGPANSLDDDAGGQGSEQLATGEMRAGNEVQEDALVCAEATGGGLTDDMCGA
ncbi:unnamed protein product [Zymoseptoria tritici ST99CH_3D1]|uniref:RING-type domain-containing protein n=2 Tax=Zymoseptoria tritici TaxID=1047171 RepID=A0A1X7RZD0_ZYMT9|nr:unnamed protein product [Zymoseptoria tritici ST99CH_3D7]SMR57932.1 unnamed protein product [Zymoseptoria tritici ST99CH_3D1]